MFAHWRDNTLFLLALGRHEATKHYQQTGRVEAEIQRCEPVPESLSRIGGAPFFTFNLEEEWRDFGDEADPSWLSYLDAPQATAVSRIIERAQVLGAKEWYFALVAGGPGTGKTSVLLALFERAWECDLVPQIIVEDQVAEYVRAAVGIDLHPYRVTAETARMASHGGILLVDDPRSLSEIKRVRSLSLQRAFKAVVVAVDPLQLVGDAEDTSLLQLAAGKGGDFIWLTSCYRQKSAIGRATKRALDAIAASSPYLADEKKASFAQARQVVTALANKLTFPNHGGRFKVLSAPSSSQVRAEVDRLLRARRLWRHWAPYLLAVDDEIQQIPTAWQRELERLPRQMRIPLSQSLSVKGLEFQHSVIVMSESLFLQLENGFEGATRRGYEARQLLRIPMSRAKDSVTVMVHPRAGYIAHSEW